MPVNRPVSSGFSQEASATANLRRDVVLDADLQQFTDELPVIGLPRLTFWLLQANAFANPATVNLQFNVRMTTGAPPIPEWLDLVPPFLLTPGVPQRLDFVFPCRAIRVGLQRAQGVATTVALVLGGAASS